jgi:DNA-binding PadR family transcriptional regulator
MSGTREFEATFEMDLNAFGSLIEIHVLHHASEKPVYGVWLIEELAEHGYKLSPGKLYPLLHSMETQGLLKRKDSISNGRIRKYYMITPAGRRLLANAKRQLLELVNEIFQEKDFRFLQKSLRSPSPSS